MFRLIITILLINISVHVINGQIIHYQGEPLGYSGDLSVIPWFDIGITDTEISKVRNNKNSYGPLTFGVSRVVSLGPENSGVIIEKDASSHIWYFFIKSKEAASLNVIFSKFRLLEGEEVYLYDPGKMNTVGPLTSLNNKASEVLPVVPVSGSEMIIEYHHNPFNHGTLEIGRISHDVLGIFGKIGSGINSKDAGACNVDINCAAGDVWHKEKRSVFRIICRGTELGTAFLLNNSNQENIAYSLTAEHVVENEFDAISSVSIFKYESPWCDGPDGPTTYSISGADLISRNENMDFSLIRLSEFPPIVYKPYLSGWSASSTIPTSQSTIHHPSGDVKKISVDYDPPGIGTFQSLQSDGFWHILQWDIGTTEGGSSGAPLFNQDHLVVGYLSGGEAVCGRSVNDYFGRFDIAYDLSSNMFESLKPWLDPAQSSITYLNGRDPYAENFLSSDTLFNGLKENNVIYEYSAPSTGISTGINSDSILAYAEKFEISGNANITEITLFIARSNYIQQADSVRISILSDQSGPGSVIDSKTIFISSIKDTFLLKLDFDEPVAVSGTFYIAYENFYHSSASTEERQFALFQGLEQMPGSSFAWFKDNSGWHSFTDHPFDPGEKTLYISVITVTNSIVNSIHYPTGFSDNISVFPNPFINEIYIETNDSDLRISEVSLIDINGRKIFTVTSGLNDEIKLSNLDLLVNGMYLLKITTPSGVIIKRLIKQNR